MLENIKAWFATNKKMALIGAGVIAVGYFGYKYLTKINRAKRLTRRA